MFNKIPMTFCKEIEKSVLKYIQKHRRPSIAKGNLSKMFNARGITIPNFKLYYRAITIKTALDWHKNTKEDKWIRIVDPDINPHIYTQVIFNKGTQNT
jgi:hypothetical protein